MSRFELIAGLDIGATKVSLAVLRREFGADQIQVLGCFNASCEGLSGTGGVVDLAKVADSVSMVLDKAQDAVKQNITTAFINIKGSHITSETVRGRSNLLSRENEISKKDIEAVFQNAKISAVSYDREPLLVVPQDYIVDGLQSIKNPIGLFGARLEIDYLFVTASTPATANLRKAVNMGGLEIEEIVLSNLASGFSALTASEKDLGVILVDIGSAVTEITAFSEGIVRYDKMLLTGSGDAADAICRELKVQPDIAAKIIKNYCKLPDSQFPRAEEDILIKETSPHKTLNQGELQRIIEPKIKGMLNKIKDALQPEGRVLSAPCGVVMIGGISSMDGLAEMAELSFNMPVKVAQQNMAALGLAFYGCSRRGGMGIRRQLSENVFKRAVQAAKDFVYDYF